MTSILVWPASLPKPLVSGYNLKPAEGVLRTNMDSGLARQRRIFTQTPTVFQVSWIMSQQEFQTFEGWYLHFAKEGATKFQIDLQSGQGIIAHTVRFKDQYQASLVSATLWQIRASLEVLNRPTVSADYLTIALNNNLDALYGGIDRYEKILETTLAEASS